MHLYNWNCHYTMNYSMNCIILLTYLIYNSNLCINMCNYNFLGIFYRRDFLGCMFLLFSFYCSWHKYSVWTLTTCAGPVVHMPHTWAGHGILQNISTLFQSFLTFRWRTRLSLFQTPPILCAALAWLEWQFPCWEELLMRGNKSSVRQTAMQSVINKIFTLYVRKENSTWYIHWHQYQRPPPALKMIFFWMNSFPSKTCVKST